MFTFQHKSFSFSLQESSITRQKMLDSTLLGDGGIPLSKVMTPVQDYDSNSLKRSESFENKQNKISLKGWTTYWVLFLRTICTFLKVFRANTKHYNDFCILPKLL